MTVWIRFPQLKHVLKNSNIIAELAKMPNNSIVADCEEDSVSLFRQGSLVILLWSTWIEMLSRKVFSKDLESLWPQWDEYQPRN